MMPQSFFVNSYAYLEPYVMPPKLDWPDDVPTPQEFGYYLYYYYYYYYFIITIIIIIIIYLS